MALLETWRNLAYGDGLDDKKKEELWAGYFQIEKGIYEQILSNPTRGYHGHCKGPGREVQYGNPYHDWFWMESIES